MATPEYAPMTLTDIPSPISHGTSGNPDTLPQQQPCHVSKLKGIPEQRPIDITASAITPAINAEWEECVVTNAPLSSGKRARVKDVNCPSALAPSFPGTISPTQGLEREPRTKGRLQCGTAFNNACGADYRASAVIAHAKPGWVLPAWIFQRRRECSPPHPGGRSPWWRRCN